MDKSVLKTYRLPPSVVEDIESLVSKYGSRSKVIQAAVAALLASGVKRGTPPAKQSHSAHWEKDDYSQ